MFHIVAVNGLVRAIRPYNLLWVHLNFEESQKFIDVREQRIADLRIWE